MRLHPFPRAAANPCASVPPETRTFSDVLNRSYCCGAEAIADVVLWLIGQIVEN